jgi:hypothetical protein
VLGAAFLASSAYATTWYVDPAGGGDFVLIQDAINAAATRDTILLARGIHDAGENGIAIQGDDGAASLVIIGEGTAEETIVRGRGDYTTTVRCAYTTPEMTISHVTIEDTTPTYPFASNAVDVTGGVVLDHCIVRGTYGANGLAGGAEASITVFDSSIEVPRASYGIGTDGNAGLFLRRSSFSGNYACIYSSGAHGYIDSCLIGNGERGLYGSGLRVTNSQFVGCTFAALDVFDTEIEGCLIGFNGPSGQRGIVEFGDDVRLANCTLVGNWVDSANDLGRAVVHVRGTAHDVQIVNNIFAFNDAVDFRTWSPDVEVTCNLFWQNAGLSHLGIFELDPSNIVADPLFCDFENGDYTLRADSPAAPLNSYPGCGLIGAFGVGCGEPATVPAATGGPVGLRAYPNPFNPVTRLVLVFDPVAGPIDLRVLDVSGRTVRQLVGGSTPFAAPVYWDGRDDVGRTAGSGVYFARLETGGQVAVTKVVVSR